ncbi:MAG: tRNA modification GTPase [Myxococcales bacterium]|nr:tRNA modification GTPase [Myxococcales bacterium]
MQISSRDTIAAIATALGEGGIGVVRISGPLARSIVEKVFRSPVPTDRWEPHRLYLGSCLDAEGEVLDEGLAVWMPAGRSYTGDDVIELQMHGGRLNLLQILRSVLDQGARTADAGEFTRRAFLNGRIDLTRAEAIVDLIAAKNEQALNVARRHLQGHLKEYLDELAERSLTLAVRVESWIDFPEEFDPALDASVQLIFNELRAFETEVMRLCDSYAQGKQLQKGWSLLLLGRPNAGKSSLFNRLHGDDRAIVTPLPGTTRDLLEAQIALGGLQLRLIDSAGLRHRPSSEDADTPRLKGGEHSSSDEATSYTHDDIEQIGVQRALRAAGEAQLLFAVMDRSRSFDQEDREVAQVCAGRPTVLILNKVDLPPKMSQEDLSIFSPLATFSVSCQSGEGLESLRQWLHDYMEETAPAHELVITNERQHRALQKASACLEKALQQGATLGPEFLAEDLRSARQALVEITGQVSSEDILDAIFSRFCIGK